MNISKLNKLDNTDVKEILDFWTLCEIVDFERFKLDKEKLFPLDLEKDSNSNKLLKDEINDSIDYKKRTINRVYIGIIKADETIKFIYNKLKQRGLIPDKNTINEIEDLEKIPNSNEFTYMAYIYVDHNYRMISIGNKSIKINPLFYILKSLLEKSIVNTVAYNDYSEKINSKFNEDYGICQKIYAVLIPHIEWILGIGNLYYLKDIKNCEIYIVEDMLEKLQQLVEHGNKKAKEQFDFLKEEKKNKKSIFKFFPVEPKTDYNDIYLETSVRVAKKYFYTNVFLLIKKDQKLTNINILHNLFITDFINKDKVLFPPFVYNSNEIESYLNFEKLEKIFTEICHEVYLTDNNKVASIFYKDSKQKLSVFSKRFFRKTFQEIEEIDSVEFLSFYINALDEKPSSLTKKYISGTKEKIDINKDKNVRIKYNNFSFFKNISAKWASEYPLYYAQQMAVNHFIKNSENESNLFSVNGPPGTGKTTLLKDVIANIITKRVEHCVHINGDLFNDKLLKEELCGKYEIVVTSNNNAAVENITKELPKIEEFDLKYLGLKKEDFLLSKFSDDFYEFESWGLISINLGNSKNINNFQEKFDELSKKIKESNLIDADSLNQREKELLKKYKKNKDILDKFNQDIELLHQEKDLDKNLQGTKESLNIVNQKLSHNNSEIEKLQKKLISFKDKEEKIIQKEKISRDIIDLKEEELKLFGFFSKIFQREKIKELKNKIKSQKSILSDLLQDLQDISNQKDTVEKQINKNKTKRKELVKSREKYGKELDFVEIELKKINCIKKEIDCYVNEDEFYQKDESSIQLTSLCADKSYLKAKSMRFALSMMLSEVYFLKNFNDFSYNIKEFGTKYKKDLSKNDQEKLRKHYAAISFILPVVSTSLASSYLMYKNISSFSTLICDEAGQATPQSMVGLLNRAKNALIVGDPLQVKPVFTAPNILVKLIQDMYCIKDIHSPLSSSVQRLADEANNLGSYYKIDDKELWVGMPLVVHRRCVDPMFSISNRISYNNKMVLATPNIESEDIVNELPPSGWIDIVSDENDFENKNMSQKEIESLSKFIQKYNHLLQDSYYIIAPFKDINSNKYKKYLGESNNKSGEKVIGTVHTFQGKEADVVFFVLGGNIKRSGTKGWVSSEPNILNVATTRAKNRIYYIGDKKLWKQHKYFNDTIDILDKFIKTNVN